MNPLLKPGTGGRVIDLLKENQKAFTFRPSPEVAELITQWLQLNPGIKRNVLLNMAIEHFCTRVHAFKPVERNEEGGG